MVIGHVAMRGHKRNKQRRKEQLSSHFGVESGSGVGGGGGGFGVGVRKSNSREKKSDFSLDFPVFGPSNFIGPRRKVLLRGKGYAWAPVLGSFGKL